MMFVLDSENFILHEWLDPQCFQAQIHAWMLLGTVYTVYAHTCMHSYLCVCVWVCVCWGFIVLTGLLLFQVTEHENSRASRCCFQAPLKPQIWLFFFPPQVVLGLQEGPSHTHTHTHIHSHTYIHSCLILPWSTSPLVPVACIMHLHLPFCFRSTSLVTALCAALLRFVTALRGLFSTSYSVYLLH